MKKRSILLTLIGAISLASLTSCSDGVLTPTVISTETTTQGNNTKTETSLEYDIYKIEDTEEAKTAYNELLKTYPNLTYDEFRLNGNMTFSIGEETFTYDSSSVTLKNKVYDSKTILIDDKITYYLYIAKEWVKISEYITINGKMYDIYNITYIDGVFIVKYEKTYDEDGNKLTEAAFSYTGMNSNYRDDSWVIYQKYEFTYDLNGNRITETLVKFEDGIFDSKKEYTYDDKGNKLTDSFSKYINKKWEKVNEYVNINGEEKISYYLHLYYDNTFDYKKEYTYDDNGEELTYTYSEYINKEWVIINNIIYNNGKEKSDYNVFLNEDGTFKSKIERTYDDLGNPLSYKYSQYINNEWVKTEEAIYINGKKETVYVVTFNSDGTLSTKYEYTKDEAGKNLITIISSYRNGDWNLAMMQENTYDEAGEKLTYTESEFVNDKWVVTRFTDYEHYTSYKINLNSNGTYKSKYEYTYDENFNNILTYTELQFINNRWLVTEYSSKGLKTEYTYDDNGKILTETTSKSINGKLVVTGFTDYEHHTSYTINLNSNGTFKTKDEYTYDDNGNKLTCDYFEYYNNMWLKRVGHVYINGEQKLTYYLELNSDNSFKALHEYIYEETENGLIETIRHSEYINNEWVKTQEAVHANDKSYLVYLVQTNSDGSLNAKYEYTYDENWNESSYIISEYEDGTWVLKNKYDYLHDKAGNETSKIYSKYENNDWVFIYREEYTYDEDGNKLTYTYSKFINNKWVIKDYDLCFGDIRKPVYSLELNSDNTYRSKTERTYDEAYSLLTYKESRYINNEWVKVYETVYINGKTKNILDIRFNSDGTFDFMHEHLYDENWNETAFIASNYENDTWVLKTKYEYKYDDNGNETIITRYDYENGKWVLDSKDEYTYDDLGKQLTKTFFKYINDEWVKIWELISINGEFKNISSITLNSDNIFEYKKEYTYDELGNTLTYIYSKYINKEWVKIQESININGELTNIYLVVFDDDIYKAKYEYTYDENGNLLIKKEYDYKNDVWELVVIHEYKYDDKVKLTYTCSECVNGELLITRFTDYINKTSFYFTYNLDGTFKNKYEYPENENDDKITITSNYENNTWVLDTKTVYHSDKGDNKLTETHSKYINNEWVKISEFIYIRHKTVYSYRVELSSTNTFKSKTEITYDEDGNVITESHYKYQDGDWVLVS